MQRRAIRDVAFVIGVVCLALIPMAVVAVLASGAGTRDPHTYAGWASQFIHGNEVGWSTQWVYPVGAVVPMLPLTLTPIAHAAIAWLAIVAAPVVIVTALLLLRAAPSAENGDSPFGKRAALSFVGSVGLLTAAGWFRLDVIAAALTVGSLLASRRERHVLAGALLLAAAFIKIWPLLMLPTVLLRARRQWWRPLVTVTAPVFVLSIIATVAGGSELWGFATLQTQRGVQVESFSALAGLWTSIGDRTAVVFQHDWRSSYEVVPRLVGAGPGLSYALAVGIVGWLVVGAIRLRRSDRRTEWRAALIRGNLALVVAVLAADSVLSPQYLLALAPLIAVGILDGWTQTESWLLWLTCGLSTLVYPLMYWNLIHGGLIALVLVSARDVFLVSIAVVALVGLWRATTVGVTAPGGLHDHRHRFRHMRH
jgi:hypothetical protein